MNEVTCMGMELRYVTLELIDLLEKENFDEINILIDRRAEIIETLQNLKCSKEELRNAFTKMNILELDKRVVELTQVDLDLVKEKLVQINNVEFVKDRYDQHSLDNPIFFNKKI